MIIRKYSTDLKLLSLFLEIFSINDVNVFLFFDANLTSAKSSFENFNEGSLYTISYFLLKFHTSLNCILVVDKNVSDCININPPLFSEDQKVIKNSRNVSHIFINSELVYSR